MGLYHYRARAYSPKLGRFLQLDPIDFDGGDLNIYGYVSNNSVNLIDPDGLTSIRGYITIAITSGIMTFQALTGNPADIKAPKTPMSERASAENKHDDERKNVRRNPNLRDAFFPSIFRKTLNFY